MFSTTDHEAASKVVEYKRKMNEDDSDFDEDYFPDYDDPGPPGMLPALVVNDDFTMIEGTAICLYLADLYKQFLPDPEHKAEYYRSVLISDKKLKIRTPAKYQELLFF